MNFFSFIWNYYYLTRPESIADPTRNITIGNFFCVPSLYAPSKLLVKLRHWLGLNKKTYEEAGVDVEGNSPGSYKEPGIGWMTGFLFVTSFVGLLALVPLRKIMIIDYKLTYPSGTATAVLINGFHTPKGDKMAKKQVVGFTKFLSASFVWACFQWFYSGSGTCGFTSFPTFGLKAFKNSFYFDFSMTYIGAGMICSHLVNLSLLAGAVLSYGVMWPLIEDRKGVWFPSSLPQSSMKSLNGYKVFISIALILGDGLYNFLKIAVFTARTMYLTSRKMPKTNPEENDQPRDDCELNEVFLRDSIPFWLAATGYMLFSIVSVVVIPIMFPELKWYYVVVAYIIAPSLGFCNAYGAGLTDMNMAYNYAPYAIVYRNMAILGVQGFSALPNHCLQLCYVFFSFAMVANFARDVCPEKIGKLIPLPMAMAVPFLVGAYFAIDMCVGSLIVFIWHRVDKQKANLMVPAVASGLICGDGLWILPSSILSLARVNPPICMNFVPTKST
ncbi:putative oligopeptide transporter, OPT superfamily [Helianthus annuus]|nr:putative oligopeptide transporter, OPT superfamily [Helianthus annuus]KAJ0553608.1 putative oligopeptide transporter, OPT superfamily [Helianthus annuus]KAJ0719272.1 putative oligopeptide transporter, OPT superfamily [Helianthus annuus]